MDGTERMTAGQMEALCAAASEWAGGAEVEIVAGPVRFHGRGGFDEFVGVAFSDDDAYSFVWCPLHDEWHGTDEVDPDQAAGLIAWRAMNETR